MPHQCPFPVRSTDNRRCYRAGSVPGCALGLALVVALLGYASLSHAAPAGKPGADTCAIPISPHAGADRMQAHPLVEPAT